jgi:hypothetical protein
MQIYCGDKRCITALHVQNQLAAAAGCRCLFLRRALQLRDGSSCPGLLVGLVHLSVLLVPRLLTIPVVQDGVLHQRSSPLPFLSIGRLQAQAFPDLVAVFQALRLHRSQVSIHLHLCVEMGQQQVDVEPLSEAHCLRPARHENKISAGKKKCKLE